MTKFDRSDWEARWSRVLREHADQLEHRPPNAHLRAEVGNLRPGSALDAGCGHGADALWLAARGWQVTAVDFSATALAHARSAAEAVGADVAERIDWVEGDLTTWTPQPGRYDLVACLYVHMAGSVEEMVRRMAAGVAPGAPCSSSATARPTRPPEPRRPRPIRCRSPSTPRPLRWTPAAGISSSPRTARGPWPAPASTR